MAIKVRSATENDLTQVKSIFEHYVLNTVASFLIQAPPLEYIVTRYHASLERKLPFLVAVEGDSGKVLGYAYASPFRGFMLGYGHTVEMTIFLDPKHVHKGIGGMLMKDLLFRLRKTKHVSKEAGYEDKPQEFEIKNVMAIMSVDDQGPKNGLAVRDWYLKWGFVQAGRLKKVGYKNGRSLDTIYLELSLE